ncbi:MAG: hypothetical protein IKD69_08635 [Solobacterium sp.]|nr:hypothetical protein [Solobacterium sp.]
MNRKFIAAAAAATLSLTSVYALDHLVWKYDGGKYYWYEDGRRQGVQGDPKNIWDTLYGLERGREIYDPGSDGWYWLDSIYGGAKALDKEVWMPYLFQDDLKTGANAEGKWVRYDINGKMIKGFYYVGDEEAKTYPDQYDNLYYYDYITGAMCKGWTLTDADSEKIWAKFNELTGVYEYEMPTKEVYILGDPNDIYAPRLVIYTDYSFVYLENHYDGMGAYTGYCDEPNGNTRLIVENCDFYGYTGSDVKVINYQVTDGGNTLILQTDLCMSRAGDRFYWQK